MQFLNQRHRPLTIDLLVLILLFLLSAAYAVRFVDFNAHPIEDAAMLMRYSQHFAQGYGIVWNIGEHPVDGATDFLFMISVGLLVKFGISLEFATRFLGFAAHFLTMGIIYFSLRRIFNAPRLIAFGSSALLMAGPGLFYVVGYFGTPFFAMFASLSWYFALDIIENGEDRHKSVFFAFASLLTGLTRPEGVLLTSFMLLAIIFIKGWRESRFTIFSFGTVFLIFGGTYFLWRWWYFGYPLPNPFYKKGGGVLHWNSLFASYLNTLSLNLTLLPAFVIGLFFKRTLQRAFIFLFPIVVFSTCFILLSNDTNILGRFQYVTLPIASMVCWPLTAGIREWIKFPEAFDLRTAKGIFTSLLVALLFSSAMVFEHNFYTTRYYSDGKFAAAMLLSEYKDSGYRLVTTEAGLLPLYSQWKSLDAWGLNDQWIAHHGVITEEYLASFDPHVIMFHAYFSPIAPAEKKDGWYDMDMVLKDYAEKHGYVLAAVYGEKPDNTEYYYVKPDFADSEHIIQGIRALDYHSDMTGNKRINFALDEQK